MSYKTKDLVKQYQSSGLTQKEFCSKNSVPVSTLQYHLHKNKLISKPFKDSVPGFIPVSMPKPPQTTSSIVIVRGIYSPTQITEIVKGALV